MCLSYKDCNTTVSHFWIQCLLLNCKSLCDARKNKTEYWTVKKKGGKWAKMRTLVWYAKEVAQRKENKWMNTEKGFEDKTLFVEMNTVQNVDKKYMCEWTGEWNSNSIHRLRFFFERFCKSFLNISEFNRNSCKIEKVKNVWNIHYVDT